MTTEQMVNLIRANNQALGHRVLQAIADRLEEQDAHLRSALGSLSDQEEVLRGLGSELAESERHRQILTTQNKELLDKLKALAEACRPVAKMWADARAVFVLEDVSMPVGVAFDAVQLEKWADLTASQLDALCGALDGVCAGVKHG
jgi:uncharacterized coiled-coil protein SlyX